MSSSSSSLSPLDDYPIHQVAEPVRRVGPTDRHFYDRYYFNLHALDEPLCLIGGFGCYPNLGVVDGFVVVVHESTHRVVRASRELGMDRMDTTVGPLRIEVLEGLQRLRLALDPNEWGIEADLVFEGSIAAQEEPRHLWRQNHRTVFDTMRLAQTGRWSGTLRAGDRTFTVSPDRWWGCRDRSWGVRPVGEPEAPGIRAANPPSMFWNYAQAQFEDFSVLYMAQEERDGTRVLEEAVRVWNDRARPIEPLGRPEHSLSFVPGTRTVDGAVLTLGALGEVRVDPGLAVHLGIGTGYGRETDWGHGMYQGPLAVQGLSVDLDDPETAARKVGVVDTVGRFTLEDGQVGYGLWEYAISGPHEGYGFASYTDGYSGSAGSAG
jgi:hypothetical protein